MFDRGDDKKKKQNEARDRGNEEKRTVYELHPNLMWDQKQLSDFLSGRHCRTWRVKSRVPPRIHDEYK